MPERPSLRCRAGLLALLAALGLALAAPAGARAVTVYAAASMRDALPRIDKAPEYSFGGSNTLQLQIQRGAPADVFVSASPQEAQALFKAGRCTRPVTFATNVLVLIVPKDDPGGVRSAYSLRSGGRRLAVGTPGVPIGGYTRKLLRRMRLSSVLSSNTVSEETAVTNIIAKVALGSADAGFVYHTDGLSARDRTRIVRLPKWAQPPVRYQTCAVRRPGADTRGARAFIAKLTARGGRRVLRSFGFGLPPR